ECGTESSLHITLGFIANEWQDLLFTAIETAVQNNQKLRDALPLGFLQNGRDALIKGAKVALQRACDDKFVASVVDLYTDRLVSKFPLDVSGQIAAHFRAKPILSDDIVGPRPGIVYKVQAAPEEVRLNFGGRTITFPDFLKEPLDFALNT